MKVTAQQVRGLLARLGATAAVPLFAFDGGYDPIALADELRGDRAQILVRIKSDRVFYAGPPARPLGGRGRPGATAPGSTVRNPPPGARRPRNWLPATAPTARSE